MGPRSVLVACSTAARSFLAGFAVLSSLFVAAAPAAADTASPGAGGAPSGCVLTGRVVEEIGGQPLPGVQVRLPDVGRGALTDAAGRFRLAGLPCAKTLVVGFHLPGYTPRHEEVRLPLDAELTVRLSPAHGFREEVTVSALPWAARKLEVAQTVDVVDADALETTAGLSVGAAVERVPGVQNVSTGEQAGKPMIRGMTNERVLLLSDGFAHHYQEFSLRHPPNVEPYDAERIEVIRGPASVLYGAGAMGGVVNLVSPPLPAGEPGELSLHGEVLAGYGDNAQATTERAKLEGALGAFGWRASWTRRVADDAETPDRELANTDYNQSSGEVALGLTLDGGVRVEGKWNHWENDFGFFLPPLPHFRLGLRNDIGHLEATFPGTRGEWKVAVHRAQNIRKVWPRGKHGPLSVDLDLETRIARIEWKREGSGNTRSWALLELRNQDNETRGTVPLLPNYHASGWAAALFHEVRFMRRKGFDRVVLDLGLRWDARRVGVRGTEGREDLADFSRSFGALTGSVGATLRVTRNLSVAANLGRGWRPPSEYEMFARGQHSGVAAWEEGNPGLAEETNLNAELGLRWRTSRFEGSLSLYRNAFDGHIYAAETGRTVTLPDGTTLPVVEYRQGDAVIEGYEGNVRWSVSPDVSLFASGSHVLTENRETGRRLPVTPPDHVLIGARWQPHVAGSWHHPYVELRADVVRPGRASGPDELFSRVDTPGYTLWGLSAGIHRRTRDGDLRLDLVVRNLFDKRYVAFLDTYKQWADVLGGAVGTGRDVRLTARWLF